MDKGASLRDRAAGLRPQPASQSSIASAETFTPRYRGKGLVKSKRSGAELKQTRKLKRTLLAKGGRCHFCHRPLTTPTSARLKSSDATVEHLVPRAQGGELSAENCVACCHSCNLYRSMPRPKLRRRVAQIIRRVVGWLDELAQAIEARRATTAGRGAKPASAEGDAP